MKDYTITNLTRIDLDNILFNNAYNLNIDGLITKEQNSNKLLSNYFIDDFNKPINFKGKTAKAREYLIVFELNGKFTLTATNDTTGYHSIKADYLAKFLDLDTEKHFLNKRQRKAFEEQLFLSQAFDKVEKGEFEIVETKFPFK